MAGSGDAIEAFGKAAMSGTDCELEHASALIHTLHYGNFFRTGGFRQKLSWLYKHAWTGEYPD